MVARIPLSESKKGLLNVVSNNEALLEKCLLIGSYFSYLADYTLNKNQRSAFSFTLKCAKNAILSCHIDKNWRILGVAVSFSVE